MKRTAISIGSEISEWAADVAGGVTAQQIQKWHEEGDFDSGDLYNLCGFDAEELGVPELENSQFSSNWTRLFHMQMLQYGITLIVAILAAPSLAI